MDSKINQAPGMDLCEKETAAQATTMKATTTLQ
jgi:hypothetical protein